MNSSCYGEIRCGCMCRTKWGRTKWGRIFAAGGPLRLSGRSNPDQLRQFLQQLHVLDQEIAHDFADIPALLQRDALQTLLQLAVKVDRQTYARFLPVKLASLRLGKVVMWLHCSSPRYCAVSFRSARRAEIKRIFALASRPDSSSSRKVWHTTSSAPARSNPRVIQRSSVSLCSTSNIDMALGSKKNVAARSNENLG